MIDGLTPFSARLTRQEEVKFRELVDKILIQQSLPEVLEPHEREELFQLLQKLELEKGMAGQSQERNETLIKAFRLLSVITFLSASAGIPVVLAFTVWMMTRSQLLTGFSIGLVSLFYLGVLAFFGKFQWSRFFIVAAFTISFFAILSLLL